jgi:hypothetical protein
VKHRWDENARDENRTVRVCRNCGMFKITRHEHEAGRPVHWQEFWRGTDRVTHDATPPCEPAEAA